MSFVQEFLNLFALEFQVVRGRLYSDLNLLHFLPFLAGPLFLESFPRFVPELVKIHYPGNRRLCSGSDFYQIKAFLLRERERLLAGYGAEIFARFVNYPQFRSGYLLIYSWVYVQQGLEF